MIQFDALPPVDTTDNENLRMPKERTVYFVALFVGLCAAAISFSMPFIPYSTDSACYLEQARSFMERGVFEITPSGIENSDVVSIPDELFPPGFPLLIIASSIIFQQPVEVVAPFLSLAALFLLPTVIVFSFHRVLGLLPALGIGMLVALTPAAVRHGYIAYSDMISLVLVIYTVNCLLTAGDRLVNWFWLGLLTGFSYLLRNANLGLLLSISLYLIWQFIVEPENRKKIIKNGLVWLGANSIIIIPLLIRNILVFGKLQPYSMPPSTVSLGENSHDYLKAQLDNILAFSDLDELLVNSLFGMVLLIMLMVVLIHQVMTTWRRWQKIEQQTFFIVAVYAAIGAAMVIAARTKYQWGVHIDARYALPYSCFVFVALGIVFKNTSIKINAHYLAIGLTIALLASRAYELPKFFDEIEELQQTSLGAAKQIKTNQDAVCSSLNGRLAVSNCAFVYRVLCAVPVRHGNPTLKNLDLWAKLGEKKGIVVSLFPKMFDEESNLPLTEDKVMKLNELGWNIEYNKKENLIISRKANISNNAK